MYSPLRPLLHAHRVPPLPTPPRYAYRVAGIGALPYGVKYLFRGEASRVQDDYERYTLQKDDWERGNVHCQTQWLKREDARASLEKSWRAAHAANSSGVVGAR
jgi:hypothetical protein